MIEGFNIRVYGLLISNGRILICEETRKNLHFFKFPGGGLEFGEGLADALKRECREEFGEDIEIICHYYTTDFFQPSAFDNRQLISVYYLISLHHEVNELVSREKELTLHWESISDLNESKFMFPVDKVVTKMLKDQLGVKPPGGD